MRFDLAVDGGAHQRIKGKHYLEFELPAGRHEFTTYVLAIWGDTRPQTVNFELKPGESLYLALNHYQGISPSLERAGGFFGLAGGLATGLAAGNGEIEGHLPGESLTTDPDGAARVAILRPQ